ncbi:hypothetical protein BAE44_0025235 [Dichanthelium oligosanthes]|uniref:Bet v I/Major latex protein domain-containing protein n=1 Tax=Dichanthelium oligosanthes TaxID=888268 RepID=A0A1E5ULL1_9POAL|nr:hypothetical protein BAE44_0025235 [Dichanthelium oligosanthes]
MTRGSKSHKVEADGVPASELWDVYATLRFVCSCFMSCSRRSSARSRSSAATAASAPSPRSQSLHQEEFVKIDNENRVKEAVVVAGDILKLVFTSYLTRLEIIEKGRPCYSVIRSTIEYEYDDGHPELEDAASTAPLDAAAEKIVQYLKEQKVIQSSA